MSTKATKSITWAYGVMTVPERGRDLLPKTLSSLSKGGFPGPALFVDGLRDYQVEEWEEEFGLRVINRWPRIFAYPNWLLAIIEIVCRSPLADYYALFQDDFITYKNLKAYLEECEYPSRGYWNLYTFPENESLCPQDPSTSNNMKVGWYLSNQSGKGAIALVFNRNTLHQLLSANHTYDRMCNPRRGYEGIDAAVVTSLGHKGIKEYVHYPSLTWHTGEKTVMGHTHPRSQPQATSFLGEHFNALDLLV